MSIKSREFMTEEKKYSRAGLNALSIITPFKIVFRSRKEGVVITFRYPKGYKGFYGVSDEETLSRNIPEVLQYLKPLNELWHNHAEKVAVIPSKYKSGKNLYVYIYSTIPAIGFSELEEKDKKYKYVLILSSVLHDYFKGVLSNRSDVTKHIRQMHRYYHPVLAEFNYKSIEYPSFCSQGLVLVTHRKTCPLISLCPLHRSRDTYCQNFITWEKIEENYAGVYRVSPEYIVEMHEDNTAREKIITYLPYYNLPFARVSFVEPVNVLAYYVAVTFLPKIWRASKARIEFSHPVGIPIDLTAALKVVFNEEVLKKVVEYLESSDAANWLRFKALMLLRAGFVAIGERFKNSIEPWRELEVVVCGDEIRQFDKLMSVDGMGEEDRRRFEEVKKFIVIHTLAHMLLNVLWTELGLSDEELGYAITKSNEDIVLWIYEAKPGGYGYLKQLVKNERKRLFNIIKSSLNLTMLQIDYCKGVFDPQWKQNILRLLDEVKQRNATDKEVAGVYDTVKTWIDVIDAIYNKHGISPHIYTVKRCLSMKVPGKLREAFSKVISTIEALFTPFDGNIGCFYFDESCISGPFIQPFAISYSISEKLSAAINIAGSSAKIRDRLEDIVLGWISTAKKTVDIATWNIGIYPKSLKALKKACNNGTKIRILVDQKAARDEISIKSIDKLLKELGNCIEIRMYIGEKVQHSKKIIIDNVALLHGSFNFTRAGLIHNIEDAWLTLEPNTIDESVKEFEELWQQAKSIRGIEDLKIVS
uniref:PLD phosphodiesterase domain-containing protein n=1 Tax=Ignisphaera aggregans TaxID=334771 RepID=A0A7J2TA81_9CREN